MITQTSQALVRPPRGAAFARGFSLFANDWIEVEIVGVPYVADHGGAVVDVWCPSMEPVLAYQKAALGVLNPQTRLARELLNITPRSVLITRT